MNGSSIYIDANQNIDAGGDGEVYEHDVILLNLHNRLINMKKERKKAEQDSQLLTNRLNMLRGEEEKVKNLLIC